MALDRATILQRNNNDLMRPYRQKLDTPLLNQENEVRRKFKERVDAFGVKEDNILSNRSLSSEGRQTALAKLTHDYLESFAFLNRVTGDLTGEAKQIRTALFTVQPPANWGTDSVLVYLKGREVRDRIMNLTQLERDSAFLVAAEQDQQGVLWALSNAPDDLPLVTDEVRTRALEARASRRDSQAFRRMQQQELLCDELAGLRDHLVLWLRELGGGSAKIHAQLGGPQSEPTTPQAARMVAA